MSEDIEKVKNITSDRLSNNEDEQQLHGVSMSDIDPAILMVSELAVQRYSKEELIGLRELPLSKKKPDIVDLIDVIPSIFDPEKWNLERKKSDTPPENGKSGDVEHGRRRNGDPRERIKKENDGIVLSPQRRSFNTGCFVPGRETAATRTGNEGGHVAIREIQSGGTRRIGSGRIIRESWGDFSEKTDQSDDFAPPFSRGGPPHQQRGGPPGGGDREDKYEGRGGREEKYDRRSFGREFDMNRGDRGEMTRGGDRGDKEKEGGRKNGRYSERRRFSSSENNSRDDEPEWFSSGPISQNDTIELRGFDDCDKLGKKKLSPSRVKRAKEWSKKKNENQASIAEEKEKDPPKGRSTTPSDSQHNSDAKSDEKPETSSKNNSKKKSNIGNNEQGVALETDRTVNENETSSFNFDDILKCDTIPGLLTNGVGGDAEASKSRFSRWFKKDSPEKLESRRSSIQDDNHIIKDLLKDINDTSVSIPGDSDSYFAPISPAANTGSGGGAKHAGQPISFVEMFQRSQRQAESTTVKQPQMAGKILSLDELEAKMRQKTDNAANMHHQKSQQKPDEEMTAAFKRMLVQAQGGTQNGPVPKPQAMSLLEMLSHSQQQDEARLAAAVSNPVAAPHLLGATSPNMAPPSGGVNMLHPQHPNVANNDLTLKLQQAQLQKQQMDMLNKFINAGIHAQQHQGHMRTSPIHDLGLQQSRELLNRPEAQAILQGLKRGEITTQHLYQQLANPALQPRHRDMLLTILKLQGGGSYGVSPRVLSPVPPPPHHHLYQQQQQQQQQLRVSPLPPNAMHQRIPSPRELQVHTQNILQRALIKKKLEEQTENYRKKQEMQRGTSPNTQTNPQGGPSKSISSPTPLAFTPTSVLRKMTADKEEGKENKAVGDGSKPVGRPLTGMRPQPQPAAQQWNQQFPIKQPAGRPIVKANPNYQPMQAQTTEQFFNQAQQHLQQQVAQQQRHFTQPLQPPNQQQQQRKPPSNAAYSMTTNNIPSQGVHQQYVNAPYPSNPQPFSQQLTQQQMRAQHQHRPANQTSSGAGQPQAAAKQSQQAAPGQQQLQGGAWQQFLSNAQQSNRSNSMQPPSLARNPLNDGSLSPTTTNQLARWFSPDLLERARGGELPSTAGLAQHALSLEEIERQTAPPVHN